MSGDDTPLAGRTIVVTGAGRGVGREHALLLASFGANVIVNDVGGTTEGSPDTTLPAESVVSEIVTAGGIAAANSDDVSSEQGAQALINQSLEIFGRVDGLVNNAGILRDRMLVNMSLADFESVYAVHQRGTFLTMRAVARHWRELAKRGEQPVASIVNTTSTSGLHSNPGQLNYDAAKSAVATMTIVAARELERYGVRVNAVAPAARTRLTLQTPGLPERMTATDGFDPWDPSHVAPLIAWLMTPDCPATGQIYGMFGDRLTRYQEWTPVNQASIGRRWTAEDFRTIAERWQTDHVDTRTLPK